MCRKTNRNSQTLLSCNPPNVSSPCKGRGGGGDGGSVLNLCPLYTSIYRDVECMEWASQPDRDLRSLFTESTDTGE